MKTIGYVRVSTEEQASHGVSLDAQKAKLEAYASLYDLELVEVICDAGLSAKTLNRPGIQKALQMLEDGEAEALLVVKLDRLTRKISDLDYLLENYFSKSFGLLSVSEQVDTRTPGGRLVLNVLASIAQWEREIITERTVIALAHKKAIGEHVGSIPYGHKLVGKKLAKAKDFETVEAILKMRSEGLTLQAIADRLNADGVKTARGGQWYPTTIKNILTREKAA